MTGWTLALILFAAFWAGAYLALLGQALLEDATRRRLEQTAKDALSPEDHERLRAYLGEVNDRERLRLGA